jgi:prepilin-type N-terminal cleavage/methylation domain-containing protein
MHTPFSAKKGPKQKGFTLIELLIVIGIIGFLAAAVLVAVDPVKRIQDARDSRRFSEANAVLNALLNKQVDRRATFTGTATAPIIGSTTLAQVIVRSPSGIDCDTAAAAPTCPGAVTAGYALSTANGVACVADLDHGILTPSNNATSVTVTATTTGAVAYTYAVVPVGANGEMLPQVTNAITNGATPANNSIAFTTVNGATSYNIYRTASGSTGVSARLGKIGNTTTSPFADGALTPTTVVAQGTTGSTTYTYKITAVGTSGETTDYLTATINNGNSTLDGTNFNRITWDKVEGALSYNVYRTVGGASQGKITLPNPTSNLTLDDTGLPATGSIAVPSSDTSVSNQTIAGPYIAELPIDPQGSGADPTTATDLALGNSNTGYFIARNPNTNRITIGACHPEQTTDIRVTR